MQENILINELTAYEKRYKLTSPYMLQSLNVIHPLKLSKVATSLFNKVLSTKMYSSPGQTKQPLEDNRIFNNVSITIDQTLRDVNTGKYEDGGRFEKGKNINSDRSNMRLLFKQIDDNNIFHMWKYNQQYECFIERHIASWKVFNIDAVIPPKTIKKLAKIAQEAVGNMMTLEHRATDRNVIRSHVADSFGRFMNKCIAKMSPAVSTKLTMWEPSGSFNDYINNLKIEAGKLDDFDGLSIADSFYKRIPDSARNILEKELSKEKNKMRNNKAKTEMEKEKTDMENELIPKDANICKNKGKTQKKKKKKSKVKESEPFQLYNFSDTEEVNPFLNAPTFARYYKTFIGLHSGKVPKFDKVGVYTNDAGVILDRLGELGKKGNIDFLNAWLRYFLATGLKGRKIENTKHTHIKKLYGTLAKFNEIFYIPQ